MCPLSADYNFAAKKIAVIGLGIIGGSLCKAFKKIGCFVAGEDRDESTLAYASDKQIIDERAENLSLYDIVFLAVPPRAAIDILESGTFKTGGLVADVCGIKEEIERTVYAKSRNFDYVGLHPMAGKETSGILSSCAELFQGANLVITVSPQTKKSAVEKMLCLAKAIGFGRIEKCTAKEHDEKIALTSQLAHIVSNAYIKSPTVEGCAGFTGGSFQDMTRIAGVDEKMWAELYFFNRSALLSELKGLIKRLSVYEYALERKDIIGLESALREGRLCREAFKKRQNKEDED